MNCQTIYHIFFLTFLVGLKYNHSINQRGYRMKSIPKINRSFQSPATLLQRVEKLVKRRGLSVDGRKFSMNAAHNEALALWCDQEEAKYKRPKRAARPEVSTGASV